MVSDLQQFSMKTEIDQIVNITKFVQKAADDSSIKDGIVTIFLPGSTGGITTLEYEPGLVKKDVPKILQKLIPEGPDYAHHQTWHDHNGHSHLRSFFIKPSFTVPIQEGKLLLGTWQQIIFCEFDEKSRNRTIYCQFVG